MDDLGNSLIESDLPEIPINEAKKQQKKQNRELYVEILFTINSKEKDQRILFPEPMNLAEFNNLMEELENRDEVEEDGEIPMENG